MKKFIYSLLIFFLAFGFICISYAQYGWGTQNIGSIENLYSDYFIDGESNRITQNRTSECLPIPFIANRGQIDNNVKFYTDFFGGTVFITKNGEIVYSFINIEKEKNYINPHTANTKKTEGIALKEKMLGARLNTISGEM
ncbi:MAG: hypothetical protein K8R58_05725 [Bacteroidales bacterium]|nr:hypothetical protein [Bacteroidales bacterium]